MALDFLKALRQTGSKTRVARRSKEPRSFRTWLEPLEERLLLASRIWDGGGDDNNWTTAANWDAAVVAGDSLIFPADAPADSRTNTNNFPADTAFASIELRGNTSYTIGGTRIALGNGGLLVNAPAGAHIWNADLLLNGLGVPFVITSGATLTVNGVLSGNAPLNKGSDGTLVLTADNNGTLPFSGFVNVNAGVLQITHPEALGNLTGETNVVDFATLRLDAGADGGAEVIRLGGTLNAVATVTWNGLVEILGTEIRVDTGATLTLDELIGDPILKTGPGTLAVADGNFGGGTVAEGILKFQGNVDVGNLTVNNGAGVELQGNVSIDAGTLSIQGVGPTSAGALRNVSGNNTWVGPVTLAAASTIGSTAGSLSITRNINNSGFLLTVSGAGNSTYTDTGVLSGSGGLTKVDAGALVLSGTGVNTYSGTTNVNGGVLNIRKASALGPSAGNGTTVATGAALHVQGGFTFNTETLTLNGAGIGATGALRNISDNNTWQGNINLASAATIGSDANTLTVNSNIANAGFLLTVTGAGTSIFGGIGVLGGGGGLTKTGAGTLRLEGTGVNNYTGATNISAGILSVRKASALGPAAGVGTTVATGAVLQVQGGVIFNAEALTLNGPGIGATGAFRNISGNNIWSGNITLAAASTIGSDAGTLTVNGNIANAGFLLSVTGAGNTVFGGAGVLGGAGGLTKTGTGTLTLEGTAANTYSGPTILNGTLRLNKQTAGTTAVPGSLAINGLNASLPAIVTLSNDNQIANGGAISINSFGTLALNNRIETIGALTMFGGDITTGTGLLTLNGNLTATSASTTGPAEISGNLSLGGVNRTFTINDGTNSLDMLISAVISSGTQVSPGFPAGLAKAGLGTLQFTGNNTYNRTEINAGRLIVDGNQSSGTALNKGVFVNSGATLAGIGTLQPLTVNSGGTVSPGSTGIGVLTSQGNLALNRGSVFAAQVVPILNAPPDRLAVTGSVNINSATLQVVSTFLTATSPGATFRIIDNDGADPVVGTFLNLPNNTTFVVQVQGVLNGQVVVQNQSYRINYNSGLGNDVVLTYLNSATMARDLAVTPDVINEGERVTLSGRLVDPDRRGPLTLQVDWGDGSPIQTRQMGAAPFRVQHRYPLGQPSGGQYRINVAWFDKHGAGNNQNLFVTVNADTASLAVAVAAASPSPGLTSLGGTTAFTGRVRAMVVRSDDPNTVWAASATGGLWVTRDAGANWSRADDFLETLTFSSLVADPNNPNVMYAGSGEIFTFIREGTWVRAQDRGAGIFKTIDGGTTWSRMTATNTPDFFYVSRIAVNPTKPNFVLAATATGLFRSVDSGANWTRVVPALQAAPRITFLDVKFHPSDPSNAVATALDQGIFFSVDSGASWQDASPLPNGLAEGIGTETRIELAPSPSQPGTWFAVHMDDAEANTPLVLMRSGNRGQTWTAVTGGPIVCDGSQLTNNNIYTGALWVNPLDPLRILVGARTTCFSTDGGTTFAVYPDTTNVRHGDDQAIVTAQVTPTQAILYHGNDGGVSQLQWPNDPNVTPTNTSHNNNLIIQQFHSATMNPISGVVVGGTQDIGTWRRSVDGVWTRLQGADDIFVATDPTDENLWYFGSSIGRIARSKDGGLTREDITPGDRLENGCFNLTPVFLDPTDPDPKNDKTLYAGCHNLWRTTNAKKGAAATGTNETTVAWSSILRASNNQLITTIAVAPSKPSVMWVGTMQGTGADPQNGREVWRTNNLQNARLTTPSDASPDFDPIDITGVPLRPISRIAVHRSNSDLAYVSLTGWPDDGSGNLWKRSQIVLPGGVISHEWRDISAGLPTGPIFSVAVHPTISNWIYAGTDAGLYVSHDDGATWSAITRGPARVPISDLTWVNDHRLVIATYGRGVFLLNESPTLERVIVEKSKYLPLAGLQIAGHVENLLEPTDGYRLVSGPSGGQINMELTGRTGLSRTGVTSVQFTIESSAAKSLVSSAKSPQLTIKLFNFVTSQFVSVFQGTVGATDQVRAFSVMGTGAPELISTTGELRARATWSTNLGSSAIDLAHWTIKRNTATMVRDLQLSPETISEGSIVTLQGALTDPDPNDFLTMTVNWGDGSPVQTRHPGTDQFELTHRYLDNPTGQPFGGQYRIRVAWFDQFGAGNSRDFFVTVNNVAPSFELGGPRTVRAGARFTRVNSFADTGADTLTATVDYGDGTGEQPLDLKPARWFLLKHRYTTAGTYTVIVTLRDDDGGVRTDSFVLTVVAGP